VRYVQNITDVDDPLLERAAATGVPWQDLAHREIDLFREDMAGLRVLPPDHYVGVVEAIDLIAGTVAKLRGKGASYELDGDLYFPVSADPRFGVVSNYDQAEMVRLSAERGGDPDRPGKKDPLDSLLWKAERPGEPAWDSVVGPGRPGWHVECTAIAMEYLGSQIDVQGGGSDLVFPHHEMGASAAQVLTGLAPWAQSYVHAGMVGLDGEKMSKSRGNLVFVSRLRAGGHDAMAIRLALLDHHYRSDWEWTDDDLRRAEGRLARWRAAVARPDGPPAEEVLAEVRRHLADDLDAPGALHAVDRWAEEQRLRGGTDAGAPGLVARGVDALLGVAL
jgi:L-cysteine:1D-myo-inositol 2-amino-2-deoxy-alpha-D-glucopyranoside ligase